MKLFLAEHRHQVADFLERGGGGAAAWVALGPGAMHSLRQRGIPFAVPEDFLSREKIEEACVRQFEEVTGACRLLDAALMDLDPFLKEWGIRPFFFHLWQLGQVADLLLSRTLILKEIFAATGAREATAHLRPLSKNKAYDLGFAPEDTVWGHLLALEGWGPQILTLPEPPTSAGAGEAAVSNGSSPVKKIRELLSVQVRGHPRVFSLVKSWHEGMRKNLVNLLLSGLKGNGPGIAFLNGVYEWKTVLPRLNSLGHPVIFFNSQDLFPCRSRPGEDRFNQNNLWELFREALSLDFPDFSPLLYDSFRHIIEEASLSAQMMIKKLERVFHGGGAKAMLTSGGFDFGYYVAKQFCRQQGIPVIAWQHGSQWHDRRITQRNDLLNLVGCDLMLVSGEGVRKGYAASPLAREEGCRIECAGMPSLKPLRTIAPQRPRDASRILWPFGGYYLNYWYCGFSPPQSDRVYYQEQMVVLDKLLALLREMPGLTLTVKLYQTYYEMEDPPWVESLAHHPQVRLVKDKPAFAELLRDHDLLLIDSPTTTLLQAAATRLPVFALMSVIRWSDEAIRLLRSRAAVADTAAELMAGLSRYLNGDELFDVHDDGFLYQYGMGREDGERLAEFLIESR